MYRRSADSPVPVPGRISPSRAILVVVFVSSLAGACRMERRRALSDLHSNEPQTRADAVLTLAELDGVDSLKRIGPLIKDPSAGVRLAVVRALSRIESDKVLPLLFTALRDSDPQIRLGAVDALAHLGSPSARDQLVAMLTDRDPVIRRAVSAALMRLGMDRAAQVDAQAKVRLQSLLSASRSKQPSVRAQAAEKLGLCGLPGALPALRRLLADPSALVADEALIALAVMGTKPALRLVRRALESGQFHVSDRLVSALSSLDPSSWVLVADAIDVDKAAVLARTVATSCRDNCPVSCDLVCRWLKVPDWRAAASLWKLARIRSCSCAAKVLASVPDPQRRVFVRLAAQQKVPDDEIETLAGMYRKQLPMVEMGPYLARLPKRIGDLVRQRAIEQVQAYLDDATSWLSERDWKDIEGDPAAKSLGRSALGPQDKKARKLARLLASYRPRSWKRVALLPPRTPLSSVRHALDLLGWLPGADSKLVHFAVRGPVPVRVAALDALANRPRKVNASLVAAIRSGLGGPVALRAAAARALRSVGEKGVVMLSRILTRDPDEAVRAAAAGSLAAIDLPQCRAALRNALRHRPEPAVIRALVAGRDGAAAASLLEALKANPEDLQMRLLLIEALGHLAGHELEGLAQVLSEQLGYPDPRIRAAAAQAMGRIAGQDFVRRLAVCVHDFSGMVRRACRRALSRIEAHQRRLR